MDLETMKVGYLAVLPWSMDPQDSSKFGGVLSKICDLLFSKLNTTYVTVRSEDWTAGYRNGNWTGIWSQLDRNEIDIMIGPWAPNTNTAASFRMFPAYLLTSYLTLASTSTGIPGGFFSFVFTFEKEIWYGIIFSMISLSIYATLSDYLMTNLTRKYQAKSFWNIFSFYNWTFLASVFSEGSPRSPDTMRGRLILSIWLLVMLVLVNSFSGQFKALLLVSGKGDVLTGIDDLAARKKLVTHFPDYHLFYQCFQETNIPAYRQVWDNIVKHGVSNSAFKVQEFNKPDLFQRVKDGKAVIVIEQTTMKINFAKNCRNLKGNREFYFLNGICGSFFLTFFASPKLNEWMYKRIHDRIRWMIEGYLIENWVDSESRNLWKCFTTEDYNEATPLKITNLSGAFILMLSLQCLASIVLIFEIFMAKYNLRKTYF